MNFINRSEELERLDRLAASLSGGEKRTFIEDGDTVTLVGRAIGDGYQIGFGSCTGTILPALKFPS